MDLLRAIAPRRTAHAHCDIPCGVYDPAQARIEAESCYRIIEKYHASSDEVFRARCLIVKEERAELAKHHIDVLWSDYFKPEHLEKFPDIAGHVLEGRQAGVAGEAHRRPRGGEEAAGAHRPDRRGLEGHQRPRHDPTARLTRLRDQPRAPDRVPPSHAADSPTRCVDARGRRRRRSSVSLGRWPPAHLWFRQRALLERLVALMGCTGRHRGAEHGADHRGRRLAARRPARVSRSSRPRWTTWCWPPTRANLRCVLIKRVVSVDPDGWLRLRGRRPGALHRLAGLRGCRPTDRRWRALVPLLATAAGRSGRSMMPAGQRWDADPRSWGGPCSS